MILKNRFSTDEQELHINYDSKLNKMTCYTNIPKYITKLQKLNWKQIRCDNYEDGATATITFEVPIKYLSFRKYDPNVIKRKKTVSELTLKALNEGRQKRLLNNQ